jgi:hypothetical protein
MRANRVKPARAPNPESDWLDVSVPSVSGHYIELEEQGKHGELLRLQKERESLKRNLMITNVELSQFGNPLWLLDFYVRTSNQGRKFGSALNGEADQLERRKQKLNAELEAVEKQITRIDPLILTIPLPQVAEIISPERLPTIGPDDDPFVLVRDYTIKKLVKRGISDDAEICKRLDSELMGRDAAPLGIPETWVEKFGDEWRKKFGWNFYFAAYRDSRTKNRMQKMISKAKTRLP